MWLLFVLVLAVIVVAAVVGLGAGSGGWGTGGAPVVRRIYVRRPARRVVREHVITEERQDGPVYRP